MGLETWPDVAVCIPTYNRARIVRRTVELLLLNLHYSGNVSIFVGCDGIDDTDIILEDMGCFVLPGRAGGVGANLNRLVNAARSHHIEYIVTMDDDHHLVAPLNLDRHVRKLRDDASAGRIHLLMEATHDEHYDPYQFVATLDHDHYWRVHWDSPEHFIMSFRPNITHKRWWEVMGFLPEGLRTGETEWTYAARCKEVGLMGGGVNVFVPLVAGDGNVWHHNNEGVSWNQQGL